MVLSGMSHAQAVIILGMLQLVYLGLAKLSRNVKENMALPGLILFTVVLGFFLIGFF
jgi:hypothetical protein